jgi:tetratricopeptide (TPR) repeat protein
MATIESMFELAIELRDKGELRDSINVFSKILDDYPIDKKTHGVYLVLGGVHADLEENDKALINFKKATELNSKSELASLGLYVTLVNLDRDEEAIHELIRYLKNNPAKLYKDTLEELLEGLEKGYMTDYEDDIRNFARINGVEI